MAWYCISLSQTHSFSPLPLSFFFSSIALPLPLSVFAHASLTTQSCLEAFQTDSTAVMTMCP